MEANDVRLDLEVREIGSAPGDEKKSCDPIDRLMNIAKVLGRKYLDEQADPELIQQFDEQFQHVIALMIQYGEEAESWEKEALQPPSAP